MRLAVLLLALVLLPLRGWLGAGMTMADGSPQHHSPAAVVQAAASPCHESASASADAAAGAAAAEAAPDAGHGACQLCQLCHSGVMDQRIALLPALDAPEAAPAAAIERFASAEPALLHKPPIS